MSDTQWPTFEVFQQERPGEPHRNVGAVHAPDADMALLNAKDVFVRRPDTHNMWIAPANQIYVKTSQQLADPTWVNDDVPVSATPTSYYVFQKNSQKPSDTYVVYVGQVEAVSPVEALQKAIDTFSDGPVWVWWVCPARVIVRSTEEDVESMFAPAHNKHYRHQHYYHTVAEMRKIKKQQAD